MLYLYPDHIHMRRLIVLNLKSHTALFPDKLMFNNTNTVMPLLNKQFRELYIEKLSIHRVLRKSRHCNSVRVNLPGKYCSLDLEISRLVETIFSSSLRQSDCLKEKSHCLIHILLLLQNDMRFLPKLRKNFILQRSTFTLCD